MKAVHVLPLLVMITLAASLVSVYGNGYTVGLPILGTTGTPALASPSLFSGAITVLYADGTPVVLSTNHVTLNLCATTCQTVRSTLKQTAPGTYTYTFTPPTSITGTVTIYIQSGSLADDNGKIFPSVDTSIGTYAAPSASPSSAPATAPAPAQAGTPLSLDSVNQAVNMSPSATPTTNQSPIVTVVAAVTVLAVLGCLLIIIPRRH
jgi:hypothetical protein